MLGPGWPERAGISFATSQILDTSPAIKPAGTKTPSTTDTLMAREL